MALRTRPDTHCMVWYVQQATGPNNDGLCNWCFATWGLTYALTDWHFLTTSQYRLAAPDELTVWFATCLGVGVSCA